MNKIKILLFIIILNNLNLSYSKEYIVQDLVLDGHLFAQYIIRKSQELNLHLNKQIAPKPTESVLINLKNGHRIKPITTISNDIENWMYTLPDDSITPDQLILKSIELSNGNIFWGIVNAYNIFSYYVWDGPRERNHTPFAKKLIDIRGDKNLLPIIHNLELSKEEYVWSPVGDNFSAWYHFLGTMIYSYYVTQEGLAGIPIGGKWVTDIMITLEEHILYSVSDELDMGKRIEMDKEGAIAGNELANIKINENIDQAKTITYLYKRLENPLLKKNMQCFENCILNLERNQYFDQSINIWHNRCAYSCETGSSEIQTELLYQQVLLKQSGQSGHILKLNN